MPLDEIAEVFSGQPKFAPDLKHLLDEQRFLAIGLTRSGRPAYVVFVVRGEAVRPLSARFMHAREVKIYEEST